MWYRPLVPGWAALYYRPQAPGAWNRWYRPRLPEQPVPVARSYRPHSGTGNGHLGEGCERLTTMDCSGWPSPATAKARGAQRGRRPPLNPSVDSQRRAETSDWGAMRKSRGRSPIGRAPSPSARGLACSGPWPEHPAGTLDAARSWLRPDPVWGKVVPPLKDKGGSDPQRGAERGGRCQARKGRARFRSARNSGGRGGGRRPRGVSCRVLAIDRSCAARCECGSARRSLFSGRSRWG